MGSAVVVDPAWQNGVRPPAVVLGPTAAVLPLPGPAAQVVVLAEDAVALRAGVDAGVAALSAPAAVGPVSRRGAAR